MRSSRRRRERRGRLRRRPSARRWRRRRARASSAAGARPATSARTATRHASVGRVAPGRVDRCAKSTIGGSRSIPLSSSFSHRSHQRIISGTRSTFGPGSDDVRRCVGPRSDHQSCRAPELLERPQRVVAIAVGPPGDDHRRRLDPVVVGAERSEPPVVVEPLVLEPREHPRLGPAHAAFPLVAPPVSVDRRHRRQRVHARSCTSGSRPGRAASPRRRSSGRRPRTDRRSRRSG